MLDPYVRPLIDIPLNHLGKQLATLGVSAHTVTAWGFIAGLISIILIIFGHYSLAAGFFALNRIFDGLDGAVARQGSLTDFGGIIDIVADFIVYSGIVFAFGIQNPDNLFWSGFLVFSFIGPTSSFLAYAIMAAKNHRHCSKRGKKSFYYLGGICEGTETTFILLSMCLIPPIFKDICLVYGILCWLTTVGRLYRAWYDFQPAEV